MTGTACRCAPACRRHFGRGPELGRWRPSRRSWCCGVVMPF